MEKVYQIFLYLPLLAWSLARSRDAKEAKCSCIAKAGLDKIKSKEIEKGIEKF